MSRDLNRILSVCFPLFFILGMNDCSAEDSDVMEDPDTLNFNIFQLAAGDDGCPTLMDPKNGRFDCVETRGLGISRRVAANITCTLVCNKGYTLPLVQNTATGKSMLLENTGVYKCLSHTDAVFHRRQWIPKQFFDCAPIRHPIECSLHFFLTLSQKRGNCDPDNAVHYAETLSNIAFDSTDICNNFTDNCSWGARAECLKDTSDWKVVLILSWPFNTDFVEQRDALPGHFKDEISKIKVGADTNTVSAIDSEAFQVICPKGTRFSKDSLCHGCYKGTFMNQTSLLCQPCPLRFYQDQDLQVTCKPCPVGSKGYIKGGLHITSCFKMHELLHETDLLTMTYCLSTVICVVFALIIFNGQVQKEADEEQQEEENKKKKPTVPVEVKQGDNETIQSPPKHSSTKDPEPGIKASLRSSLHGLSKSVRFRSLTSTLFSDDTTDSGSRESSSGYSDSV